MSKKAEESYFERMHSEVLQAYARVGSYSPEEMRELDQLVQVLTGNPLTDHVCS